MVIDTCFLFGKDADSSIFILGERPKIQKGDWVRPNDTIEFRRSQQVIFRPKEEGITHVYLYLLHLTVILLKWS